MLRSTWPWDTWKGFHESFNRNQPFHSFKDVLTPNNRSHYTSEKSHKVSKSITPNAAVKAVLTVGSSQSPGETLNFSVCLSFPLSLPQSSHSCIIQQRMRQRKQMPASVYQGQTSWSNDKAVSQKDSGAQRGLHSISRSRRLSYVVYSDFNKHKSP